MEDWILCKCRPQGVWKALESELDWGPAVPPRRGEGSHKSSGLQWCSSPETWGRMTGQM